ncbi:MAG TPA: Ig-like domain-containing protein, partial [Kofleriaceae bacterium]|nr:Ig-like domain-containing protein [Kofleriaceae bacterium]
MAFSHAARKAAVVSAVVWLGCGGASPHDLQVMSYAPRGALEHAAPVEIKFDKPVVDAALVGTPIAPGTVTIAPAAGKAIQWKGHWQDRQTLTLEPTGPLAGSTRYHVALAGELARRTAGFQFELVNRPLAVEGLWGVEIDSLATDAALPLSFNQPVRPLDAAAHCRMVHSPAPAPPGAPAGIDLALTVHGTGTAPAEPATQVSLRPAQPLTPGAAYTLTCDG